MSNATAFVRASLPACAPGGLPLVPIAAPVWVAVAVCFFVRFGSFWYARAFPDSQSWCARQGRATAEFAVRGRYITFHTWVTSMLGIVTCSEDWAMALSRVVLLIANLSSIIIASVCLVQPLSIMVAVLANVGVSRVAFTTFVSKSHGVNAGLLVLLLLFTACNLCVSFLQFQSYPSQGSWKALLALSVIGAVAFFAYVGVVALLKHHAADPDYAVAVAATSWSLNVAEYWLCAVFSAILFLVNTTSFSAG